MIYFTGDLHGEWDIAKLNSKKAGFLTRDDVVVIAGDFGLVWDLASEKTSKHWLDWLDQKPFLTLFCDGNHENFTRLLSGEFQEVDMFGDKVKQISKKVFELQTGHLYNIQGKKVFVFGGAMSVDRAHRTPYKSWWPEEIPDPSLFRLGIETLKKNENRVDYILSHATHRDCYLKALDLMPSGLSYDDVDPLLNMLQSFKETVSYDLWVCGHYHLNCFDAESNTAILYNLVMPSDELEGIVKKGKDTFCLKKL